MTSQQNVFLIGQMGAGKTAIGRLLAKVLGFEFIDSDQMIENQAGASIPWIFDLEGEEGFRKREAKVIDQVTQETNIVLATGGGVILDPLNRKNLISRGVVVYLVVSLEEQIKRTAKSKNRPLMITDNVRQIFENLRKAREPLYLETADYIINTDDGSIKSIVDSILDKIKSKPLGSG